MAMDKDLPKQILKDMYIVSRSELQMQDSLGPVNVHLKNRSFMNILEKHLLFFSRYLQPQIKQYRNTAQKSWLAVEFSLKGFLDQKVLVLPDLTGVSANLCTGVCDGAARTRRGARKANGDSHEA